MKRALLPALVVAVAGTAVVAFAIDPFTSKFEAEKKEAVKPVTRYVHTVIFTLKKDAPKDEESQIIADCHKMLSSIGSVRHLTAGRPAEKGTPKFEKKDYNVALTVVFDNYDGLTTYDKSEQHQAFLKKHLAQIDTDKLIVYDYEDQAK